MKDRPAKRYSSAPQVSEGWPKIAMRSESQREPSVPFDYNAVDPAADAIRSEGVITGRLQGFQACIALLDSCGSPKALSLRFEALCHIIAPKRETIVQIARRLNCRRETVHCEIRRLKEIKEFIYNRLTLAKPAEGEDFPPGFAHFPDCYDEEFFRQLLSEEGGTKRNEVLDCTVLAEAALYARRFVNWDLEERQNIATIPAIGAQMQEWKVHLPPRNNRGGLGSGWRL